MKKNKIIFIIFILIIIALSFMTVSYGFGVNSLTGNQTDIDSDLKNAGNGILKVVSTIGVVVSVVVLVILGIKYMMGSVEERAEYKKSMMPYMIGAALVFAASSIAQVIYKFAITI